MTFCILSHCHYVQNQLVVNEYLRRKDIVGKVERYKIRLVANGFTQKEDIDYKQYVSPISLKDSFMTIMTLTTYFNIEIYMMDATKKLCFKRLKGYGLQTKKIHLQAKENITTIITPKIYFIARLLQCLSSDLIFKRI